jgi:hypothetical protein
VSGRRARSPQDQIAVHVLEIGQRFDERGIDDGLALDQFKGQETAK